MSSEWPDKQLEMLHSLFHREDEPAFSTIAALMRGAGYDVTRNSVLAKVHRLAVHDPKKWTRELMTRHMPVPGAEPRPRAPKPRNQSPPRYVQPRARAIAREVLAEPPPPLQRPDGTYHTTLTISDQTCKWPIGDPQSEDFHYCGHHPQPGSPYCPAHDAKSYQPRDGRSLNPDASYKRLAAWVA